VRKAEVLSALEIGYRAFDTAQNKAWGYKESDVGEAIEESFVDRKDVFLQTKISPYNYKRNLRDSIESSFRNLRTSYIDSIILHTADSGWKEAYRVLEEYVAESRVHRIGVSNFDDETLLELIEFANVQPSVVQNWNDVLHQDTLVRAVCAEHDITYQAYSSLGNQWFRRLRMSQTKAFVKRPFVSNLETLRSIALSHEKDVPELVYRWQMQSNIAVIATSRDPVRQRENLESLRDESFALSPDEMAEIDRMDGKVNEVIQMRRVSFWNHDAHRVLDVFWLDREANTWIWKGGIESNRSMDMISYVGHVFVLKSRGDDSAAYSYQQNVTVADEPLHQRMDWNGSLSRREEL
jgi:diketogulonate reductase-like aldo/keto reductase